MKSYDDLSSCQPE